MKFISIIALTGLVAFAAAAPQASPTDESNLTPESKCVAACDPEDRCCSAECVGVPCPDEGMANSTNDCVAKCPQGSGTPEDADKYSKCTQECIGTEFFTGGAPAGAAATPTPSSGSDSSSDSSDSSSDSDATGSDSSATGTSTESGSSPSSTGAASNIQVGASAAGVVGLLMAALAL